MNPSEYANDSFLTTAHRPADPKVTARVRQLVSRAEQLEEARLSANPNDVEALYDRGITRAQFSAYTGLVERAWISGLRNAVGARRDHERVLELDPNYTDAKLVVGVHHYVVGSLPLPVKLAVSMVGLSGDKAKGLAYLAEVANSSAENHTDAEIAWALFLRREKRYGEALEIDRSLTAQFPQNVIFALEEGSLLRALNHNADAEASYRKVWQDGRYGKYGTTHYEFAALYLGDLLRSEKQYAAAAEAYASVNQVANPDPEVLQKANLRAGEMYDRESKRDLAVKSYTAAINVDDSNGLADVARRRLKQPYGQD
jgi:tetratricopeptide (TPR) repeat protein